MNTNNNEYNIKLYNSVFNNIYLKRIIFNHLTIYNILYNNVKFKSHEQWQQFKYKDYLNNVELNFEFDLSKLPENIKHIKIDPGNSNLNLISHNIKSIGLSSNTRLLSQISTTTTTNILSKIKSLKLELIKDQQKELNNNIKILPSLTELSIRRIGIREVLNNGIESSGLKRIYLFGLKSIEGECKLESLSVVRLIHCSPSIIKQISSNCLVKLDFWGKYNVNIDVIFPETLQKLSINCCLFNSKLPNNLKSLKLIMDRFENTIVFPSSLENLTIKNGEDKKIFNNRESVPCNMKSLEITCSSTVDNNGHSILPDKLETLIFSVSNGVFFNQVLQVNQLPSSLTYLNLGDAFNQVIDVNVLPSNLKKLILGYRYSQIINPLAIPQQLELLEIKNLDYAYSINLSVSTHPNTLILCNKLNLYYNPSNTTIRKLKLPQEFNSPLSTLQLQDKSSLEYLHLGFYFNQPIELSDLPINNNIKTLVSTYKFSYTINLEHFQNLETIIIRGPSKITTTKITTNQQDIIYNNYNLKNIIVSQDLLGTDNQFMTSLDRNFYQFLKRQ